MRTTDIFDVFSSCQAPLQGSPVTNNALGNMFYPASTVHNTSLPFPKLVKRREATDTIIRKQKRRSVKGRMMTRKRLVIVEICTRADLNHLPESQDQVEYLLVIDEFTQATLSYLLTCSAFTIGEDSQSKCGSRPTSAVLLEWLMIPCSGSACVSGDLPLCVPSPYLSCDFALLRIISELHLNLICIVYLLIGRDDLL